MSHRMEQATIGDLYLTGDIRDQLGTVVFDPTYGPIYTDTVTGTRYYITIDNGVINKNEVSI